MLSGVFLLHKPAGVSSHGAIQDLKNHLAPRVDRIGHAGTLDPFASGLIVALLGGGTRLSQFLMSQSKTYETTVRFGSKTSSGDLTTEFTATSEFRPSSIRAIQEAATRLESEPYLQSPPMHSAKKVAGKPLYELARKGIEIERKPILKSLKNFVIHTYDGEKATFTVDCESGTYVRTLCEDLAERLGTLGVCETLVRTRSGSFSLSRASLATEVTEATLDSVLAQSFIPFDEALNGFESVELPTDLTRLLSVGQYNRLIDYFHSRPETIKNPVIPIKSNSKLIGIMNSENGRYRIVQNFSGIHSHLDVKSRLTSCSSP